MTSVAAAIRWYIPKHSQRRDSIDVCGFSLAQLFLFKINANLSYQGKGVHTTSFRNQKVK